MTPDLRQIGTDELRRELERRENLAAVVNANHMAPAFERDFRQSSGAAASWIDPRGRKRDISLGMRFGRGVSSERNALPDGIIQAKSSIEPTLPPDPGWQARPEDPGFPPFEPNRPLGWRPRGGR